LFGDHGGVAGGVNVGELDFQRLGGAAEKNAEGKCSGQQGAFEVHGGHSCLVIVVFKAQRCS